jgi:RHS repeat-associated protein
MPVQYTIAQEIDPEHLNTPRLIADSTGTAVWRNDNTEPFGNNPPDENPSGLGVFLFPLRESNYYHDAETNQRYAMYRDCYDPTLGRFCQSDPIGLRGGLNTYAYGRGAPTQFVDPTGTIIVNLGLAGIGGLLDVGIQIRSGIGQGQSFAEAVSNINVTQVGISAAASGVGLGPVGVGISFFKNASLFSKTFELLTRAERQQISSLFERALTAGLISFTKSEIFPWRPWASSEKEMVCRP